MPADAPMELLEKTIERYATAFGVDAGMLYDVMRGVDVPVPTRPNSPAASSNGQIRDDNDVQQLRAEVNELREKVAVLGAMLRERLDRG